MAAFVGENAYGILADASRAYLDLAQTRGFVGRLFDLTEPDWSEKLAPLIRDGLWCGWGYTGYGATLLAKGQNAWDVYKVPFVSLLADPPYWRSDQHFVRSRYVVNGYFYRDWLDIQRDLVRSPQVSALLPIGIFPNARRDAVPWSKRSYRMAFVKGGQDPQSMRAKWSAWPAPLRTVLEDSAAELCRHTTGPITGTVLACLAAHDLFMEERKDLLFGLLTELDLYVRAVRSTAMAKALHRLPVDIFGPGWDHVRSDEGRARFHRQIPSTALDDLYADTQYLVNVNPNFASGPHERVLCGFAAKCCVVSDDNAFSRANLSDLTTYRGVEWTDDALADKLAEIYHDGSAYDDATQPALDLVERDYKTSDVMDAILKLAAVARFSAAVEDLGP